MTHQPEFVQKVEQYAHQPESVRNRDGIFYACFDKVNAIETGNPFIVHPYDFQEGFYRGDFEFSSPLTGEMMVSTPEMFGRHKIVRSLIEMTSEKQHSRILDIGSGTLDIARAIPKNFRSTIRMFNSDISGPWTSGDGQSALERGSDSLMFESEGVHGFEGLINLQHNFNISKWPFADESMDVIVSNMALHHIETENKQTVLKKIFNTLRPGGALILNDVYSRQEDRAMLTKNGERGPSECKGYPVSFAEAFELYSDAGFTFDDVAHRAKNDESNITEADVEAALDDDSRSIPISNSVWFTILRKKEN